MLKIRPLTLVRRDRGLSGANGLDIYVGTTKAKCSACGCGDWVLLEPTVELRAMTELKCGNCQRVVLYAELVIQTPVEMQKPPDG